MATDYLDCSDSRMRKLANTELSAISVVVKAAGKVRADGPGFLERGSPVTRS